MTTRPFRMTRPTIRILSAFLGSPSEEFHGYKLMKDSGLSSGTIYPVLAKLERAGWITGYWETEKESRSSQEREHGSGRARRCYKLTPSGLAGALAHSGVICELAALRRAELAPDSESGLIPEVVT